MDDPSVPPLNDVRPCFDTGCPGKHEVVFFWYLKKVTYQLCVSSVLYTFILCKVLFSMYQKNIAMFNWSPCRPICCLLYQ